MHLQKKPARRSRLSVGACLISAGKIHLPLRQLAFASSAQLLILCGTGGLARTEDRPADPIFSACRVPPRGAVGDIPKLVSKEAKTEQALTIAARRLMSAGEYDRAIEEYDKAIEFDSKNPRFYLDRGIARRANHQLNEERTSIVQ
jgi:tetratricopeptide (TPR) repeat protein